MDWTDWLIQVAVDIVLMLLIARHAFNKGVAAERRRAANARLRAATTIPWPKGDR